MPFNLNDSSPLSLTLESNAPATTWTVTWWGGPVSLAFAAAAGEVTATPDLAIATASAVARSLELSTTPAQAIASGTVIARTLELATGPAIANATASTAAPTTSLEISATPAIATATGSAATQTTSLEVSATPTIAAATASGVAPAEQLETGPATATATASAVAPTTTVEQSATPTPATATAAATDPGQALEVHPDTALAVAGLPEPIIEGPPVVPAFPIAPWGISTQRRPEEPTEIRVTPDIAVAWAGTAPPYFAALEPDQAVLWPTIDGELPAIPSRYRAGLVASRGYLAALRELDPDLPRVALYAWPPRRPLRQNEQLASMQALDSAIDKGRTRVALAGAPAAAQAVQELAEQAVRAIVTGQPAILEALDLSGPARALAISIDAELEYLRAFGASTVLEEFRRQSQARQRPRQEAS